jgi:PD-(D/E)XK endonuclease
MARAAGQGLRVSKPYGESASYDVGVECVAPKGEGRILRVQVKSTLRQRRHESYSLSVIGPGRERYPSGVVDFFAMYLIPLDTWYIIPYALVTRTNHTVNFTPASKRHKYARYREAWHLLRDEAGA